MVAAERQMNAPVPHETEGDRRHCFLLNGQMTLQRGCRSRCDFDLLRERKGWGMRSIKFVVSVLVLVAGCSAILWPGVFAVPTASEVSTAATSEAAGYTADSVEELLESLGLGDADVGELVTALGVSSGSEDTALEEVSDVD